MGHGYNETVLEGEWSKMRIYEATIADLDGLASVLITIVCFIDKIPI